MSELQKQFQIMDELVKDNGDVHKAFIEMTKLLKMFYAYLESKNDS